MLAPPEKLKKPVYFQIVIFNFALRHKLAAYLLLSRAMNYPTPQPEAIQELDARMSQFIEAQEPTVFNPQLTNLKLQLTQAAMCHEYARMEYDKTICVMRRGELVDEMGMYQSDYLEARQHLNEVDPQLLQTIELELRAQKQQVFSEYHA